MVFPKKKVKLVPMLLYFAIEESRWKYLKKTINTVNPETLEPALPYFFEGKAAIPDNPGKVAMFAIVMAEDFSGAWDIARTKFPIDTVYWTVGLPEGEVDVDDIIVATGVYDNEVPGSTDPMMMEFDNE